MNRFLALLFFIMINSDGFSQPASRYVMFSLNENEANGILAAIEYYNDHYPYKIYGMTSVSNGSDIIVSFGVSPSASYTGQRGGGGKVVHITYSQASRKIIKAFEAYAR